jgi:pyridoxamine 5'-phosphate oxidase
MEKRTGIFEGNDPFALARDWMSDAEAGELNDPNAMALSTVDGHGMPNVRIVLLKSIEDDGFVFYTNYESKKAQEAFEAGRAAFVIHWKSLRRQIRCRGFVEREDGPPRGRIFHEQIAAFADRSRGIASVATTRVAAGFDGSC